MRHVPRLFYRDTAGFTRLARERRAGAIAQADEDSFYSALNQVLATLGDVHSHAVAPGERAANAAAPRNGGSDGDIG